jgi:hypothetical protein
MKPNSPTPPKGFRIVEPEELREKGACPGLMYRFKNTVGAQWTRSFIERGQLNRVDLDRYDFAAPSHPAPSEAGLELLPCPFCGNRAQVEFNKAESRFAIGCSVPCPAGPLVLSKVSLFSATEYWNRRPAAQPTPKGTVEVLRGLLCLFSAPDEDSLDHWERVAELFRKETGFLRPGKDQAAAAYGPSDEQRQEAWQKWYENKVTAARALLARLESEGE